MLITLNAVSREFKVIAGTITKHDTIKIVRGGNTIGSTIITDIEQDGQSIRSASEGMNVVISLENWYGDRDITDILMM